MSLFWAYYTRNPPQCKMSRNSVQRVPGFMRRANGRRDRKKCRRIDRHGDPNSHFCNFVNALKNTNFSVSYTLCIIWNKNFLEEQKMAREHCTHFLKFYLSFYYFALFNTFSHQQLFQLNIFRHKQAETFTSFCYLTYWRRNQ